MVKLDLMTRAQQSQRPKVQRPSVIDHHSMIDGVHWQWGWLCFGLVQEPVIVPPLRLRGLTASALRTAMSSWMPLDSVDDVKTGGAGAWVLLDSDASLHMLLLNFTVQESNNFKSGWDC